MNEQPQKISVFHSHEKAHEWISKFLHKPELRRAYIGDNKSHLLETIERQELSGWLEYECWSIAEFRVEKSGIFGYLYRESRYDSSRHIFKWNCTLRTSRDL